MKIGDVLYCKKSYYHLGDKWITENKYYQIVCGTKNSMSIIDDENEYNNRLLTPENLKLYFYTEQEYRKEKLKKINECRR